MGCSHPRGHAYTLPSCGRDVLLLAVLDVLDLDVVVEEEVVVVIVVTACARRSA